MNLEDILKYLKEEIAIVINQTKDSLDENTNFLRLGISSIETLKLVNKIQKKLNIEVNPIAMFEYKTIAEFSEYLQKCVLETEGAA